MPKPSLVYTRLYSGTHETPLINKHKGASCHYRYCEVICRLADLHQSIHCQAYSDPRHSNTTECGLVFRSNPRLCLQFPLSAGIACWRVYRLCQKGPKMVLSPCLKCGATVFSEKRQCRTDLYHQHFPMNATSTYFIFVTIRVLS